MRTNTKQPTMIPPMQPPSQLDGESFNGAMFSWLASEQSSRDASQSVFTPAFRSNW